MKERIVWDLEANGLRGEADKIWCISTKNIDDGTIFNKVQDEINKDILVKRFKDKIIIGHNIINYDIPMIKDFYGLDLIDLVGQENIIDTYIWSMTLYPDRQLPKGCPESIYNPVTKRSQKIGPHGLESWGYRVGHKKIEIHDWTVFDENIINRCMIDVEINEKVYYALLDEAGIKYEI